jgi:tetratricopeptide (TPR) repeat protein
MTRPVLRSRLLSPAARHLSRLGLIALSLAAAQVAAAEPRSSSAPAKGSPKLDARASAKAEVQKAQVDYELGRFDKALERYTHAYELYPVPALLFNLGQCHRNLKNPEHAIFFFEGYLREASKIDKSQRALTEDLIAESRAVLARQQVAAEAAAVAAAVARVAPPRLEARPPEMMPSPPPPAPLIDRERDQAPRRTSVARKWWFWTALGVATTAAAVAYYATGEPRLVPPAGSVGTVDRR